MMVIDASVFMALLYQDEPGHIISRTWFGVALTSGQILSSPVIMLAEVAAAISRSKSDSARAGQFVQLLANGDLISLYPVTFGLAERAAEIAADYKIRGCDAVYVALAEQLGEELVTLDNEQLSRGTDVVTTRRP
ncbi:MAG: type II toxin-antitoxin system VapC family toxin [Anaerolineae bacterium]|nr:type II toxin-antitoxin system VapC family toxin [Anaerolineae bacterium]